MKRAALVLLLVSCAEARTYVDAASGSGSTDARYAGCEDVARAYEAARERFGCSYDWPACPRTLTDAQCVEEFAGTVSCGHLDTIASRCSL